VSAAHPVRARGALGPLVGLLTRTTATRGRVLGLAGLGLVGVVVAAIVGHTDPSDPLLTGARFIDGFGLSVLAPIVVLVFATAGLGDPIDDGTLVYLWFRPRPRWTLAAAAVISATMVSLPLVVVPLVVAAALTGGGDELVAATAVAAVVAVVAYAGLFVALGAWVRRALSWGVAYVLIWEGFIARAGGGANRLSVRGYSRSVLASITGLDLSLADAGVPLALAVAAGVAVAGVGATALRLRRGDVA